MTKLKILQIAALAGATAFASAAIAQTTSTESNDMMQDNALGTDSPEQANRQLLPEAAQGNSSGQQLGNDESDNEARASDSTDTIGGAADATGLGTDSDSDSDSGMGGGASESN